MPEVFLIRIWMMKHRSFNAILILNISIVGADPYVYIKCEGKTARSPHKDNTLNPEWDFQAIFYRKKPQNPIVIEVRKKAFFSPFNNL